MTAGNCRFCNAPLKYTLCDLGMSPLSNRYLPVSQLQRMEPFYPLHAQVCDACYLVQLQEYESPTQIFSDYAYFSSYSSSWLEHARSYANEMIARFRLGATHQVIELASNDGYLLQYFKAAGIPVLGIEPAKNVAAAAQAAGIPTQVAFFGRALAEQLVTQGLQPQLLIGNNVLAHVPDLNDFVAGMKLLLPPTGIITMEFPHLLRLLADVQFDTIYHEHFSYFSLLTVQQVFARHGLALFDVETLPTHGGSLRIYACHIGSDEYPVSSRIAAISAQEQAAGLDTLAPYQSFDARVRAVKRDLLAFLIQARNDGKRTVGYGAPAKGNTLLNYCGIRADLLDYTVDRSPHKQGLYLPGTHLPILAPEQIFMTRPDYVLILPWNLKEEIMGELAGIREWGGQFVIPIPGVQVLP